MVLSLYAPGFYIVFPVNSTPSLYWQATLKVHKIPARVHVNHSHWEPPEHFPIMSPNIIDLCSFTVTVQWCPTSLSAQSAANPRGFFIILPFVATITADSSSQSNRIDRQQRMFKSILSSSSFAVLNVIKCNLSSGVCVVVTSAAKEEHDGFNYIIVANNH